MQKIMLVRLMLALAAGSALAQSGPLQLERPASRKPSITTYADADGKQRAGQLTVAELHFPLRVFEETPTGMVRIQHGEKNYWVAGEDFNIRRSVQADCNVAMARITTGADRGANENCAGVKKK